MSKVIDFAEAKEEREIQEQKHKFSENVFLGFDPLFMIIEDMIVVENYMIATSILNGAEAALLHYGIGTGMYNEFCEEWPSEFIEMLADMGMDMLLEENEDSEWMEFDLSK